MRHSYAAVLAFSLLPAGLALAQTSPVITRADMPVATDTLRQSMATPILPGSVPPLTQRGPNQTWNYSTLVPISQNVARFTAVPNQPLYTFTFNSVLSGSNRATVAAPQTIPLPPGISLPITDPYQFYNASAADFRSVGYGASLSGTAVPITYANAAQQDVVYRFPLSYASTPDSSSSFFSISVPGTGYLSQRRKRVNRVDAWGSLTTPFGTFQTVRVVTRIEDQDSISAMGINQGITLPVMREYKWLAVGQHVPLLTITTTRVGNQDVVASVEYRDVYRRLSALGTASQLPETALSLYPNPVTGTEPLRLQLPAAGPVSISATDLTGRVLFSYKLPHAARETVVPAAAFGAFRGVALLRVQTATGMAVRRVVRE
ncbi:T9SS type A sorting domain-containing protein [Hymenobacter sp. BT186]|uniref:T9SS type A sorting domain-containing protein n=1 Tax=Hymenobacter telluris TaxID=2816474 RepID=A0A939JDW9_9BACT|nr:T9SS type A sorting domain-containing protein [Hymenobacter telluris]MBO0358782.1 T9SS type A sorting domain-containing protein [Hymenobacter telluris]MBW3374808.1 T9SS type A sorting domain-containing protein [Hymenobacter norwichensis]